MFAKDLSLCCYRSNFSFISMAALCFILGCQDWDVFKGHEGNTNSLTPKAVDPIGSNREPALSDDEAHRIALNAIKGAAGISNICSYTVHLEEGKGRVFQVVTFLAAPLSDSKMENFLYKVGFNPTNGQVLFIRLPAN